MEELKRLVENTEKEKEDVKQVEMDMGKCVQEVEEYDRQVEKEEREKERCWSHAGTLDTFIRGIRLHNSATNVSITSCLIVGQMQQIIWWWFCE